MLTLGQLDTHYRGADDGFRYPFTPESGSRWTSTRGVHDEVDWPVVMPADAGEPGSARSTGWFRRLATRRPDP